MFNFEKLEVWKKSIELADTICARTRTFPTEERFGLTISSNIVEGSPRSSKADFARFIEIGTGSVFELASQMFIARRQGLLAEKNFQEIYADAQEIGRMLSGLRNSLKTK